MTNQNLTAEKAVQVAEMQRIYSQAKQVVVWLGDAENDSDLVIDNMEAFLQWGLKVRDSGFVPDEEGFKLFNPPPDVLSLAFGRFLARPWFHRVWVVQEMLLAKDAVLVCGSRVMNWKIFCLAVLLMKHNGVTKLLVSQDVPRSLVEIAVANIIGLTTLSDKAHKGLSPSEFTKPLDLGRLGKVTEPVDPIWGIPRLGKSRTSHSSGSAYQLQPRKQTRLLQDLR